MNTVTENAKMIKIQVDCPCCAGTGRVSAANNTYKKVMAGYDAAADTLPCRNCGGQYMSGAPTGKTLQREDGTACVHEYTGQNLGRCYNGYTCQHCGDYYTIDSGG